ncbi:MAG: TRAP transporter substrate-binding protein DctP [Deltaproteobacteria bacterium]|nr:TRAP transporter substrate-binding protein DctP [Deltaproteobacteria bacterium]
MMKKCALITSVVCSLVVLLLAISATARAQEELVIKMATLAPEGSSWIKTFNTINAEVMEKTGNKVKFKIYAGGVLGDEKDMLRKMQIGQIHGAGLTTAGLSVLFKDIDVLHIPFLFQDYDEVDYILKKMGTYFTKGLEDNGYILLGWSEAGFVYLMSTTPIASVSELKKAKVWIWHESPLAKAIFDEAGVSAIPLSVPDVLIGLQTGMVDVVYTPPTAAISLQWFTKIKYLTNVPLVYMGGGLVVKKDVFKKLPQSWQDTITTAFQRNLDQLKTVTRSENQEAITVMKKHGVKIITPSADQIAEFKRLSDTAMARLVNKSFSKKVMDEVTTDLEIYRKGKK